MPRRSEPAIEIRTEPQATPHHDAVERRVAHTDARISMCLRKMPLN